MKVLLINGSPNKEGCTYTALRELESTLNAGGIETEILYLAKSLLQAVSFAEFVCGLAFASATT